jgi:hypothetical protein
MYSELGSVAHDCNLRFSGGWDRRITSSRLAWDYIVTLYLKKKFYFAIKAISLLPVVYFHISPKTQKL